MAAAVVMAGAAATLAGCGGCAGCNNNSKNTTLTNSNWYTGTSYKGIQPSFIKNAEHPEYKPEVILYDVTHDGSSNNSTYAVEYKDGAYTTEFYGTTYDWSKNAYHKAELEETVYCYKTELTISVRYSLKKGNKDVSEWFTDSMISESYFRAAGKNLQPVYSMQIIKSTSPDGYQVSSLAEAYTKVDVTYENYYDVDCKQVTSVIKEAGKDEVVKTYSGLNKVKNTLFDNAYLYTAVRSMKLSKDLSQTINLFSAAAGGVSTYTVEGSNSALPEDQLKTISAALTKAELYTPVTVDGEGNTVEDKGVPTVAVDVKYAGGNLQGTTQRIWYAAIQNIDNNTARCTMLKIAVPLSYNLGTLNFTLNKVESTLWSK